MIEPAPSGHRHPSVRPSAPARPRAARLPPVMAALALGAALALLPSFAAGIARAQERPLAERPVPTIRVQGEGEIAVAPDMAIVGLTVLREADTARAALDANNAAMAEVLAAMKAEGIAQRDLQTGSFSIQPRFTRPSRTSPNAEAPRIDGYQVTNTLSVRLRELDRLGAVLDKAVSLGVNAGGDIAFANAETGPIVEKARTAAMRDAVARAQTLAGAAGVGLGPILEITENYSSPRPVAMARGKMALEMAADSVPVAAGESTYSVTVNVTWELAQ